MGARMQKGVGVGAGLPVEEKAPPSSIMRRIQDRRPPLQHGTPNTKHLGFCGAGCGVGSKNAPKGAYLLDSWRKR